MISQTELAYEIGSDYRDLPAPRVLCVIPARGGSKGFPGKNVALLRDKPLLAHTIKHAQEAECITDVFVSTEDDDIAAVAETWGAKVIRRPQAFADDWAPSEWAILHVLGEIDFEPEYVVMLQCTSPIRKPHHIDEAFHFMLNNGCDSLLSVVQESKFRWVGPTHNATPVNYHPRMRPMRQVGSMGYVENGSIYITKTRLYKDLKVRVDHEAGPVALYVMPLWSKAEIDQPDDLDLCEWILEREPG